LDAQFLATEQVARRRLGLLQRRGAVRFAGRFKFYIFTFCCVLSSIRNTLSTHTLRSTHKHSRGFLISRHFGCQGLAQLGQFFVQRCVVLLAASILHLDGFLIAFF
jgi:hypothetical protein